jgi:Flp pilus assembly protein TadD
LTGALKQAPGDARLYNNLGVVAQARGDLNTAREYYARASALAPNWELPKQNLGALGK